MDNTELINTLNVFYTVNDEAAEGYREAAEGVDDDALQTTFNIFAQQRKTFAERIREEILNLGEEPQEAVTLEAAAELHKIWIDVRAAVSDGDPEAMLDEVLRGEHTTKALYEELLTQELPEPIATLLAAQLDVINEAVSELEEAQETFTAETT